jgi:hypothetical protein
MFEQMKAAMEEEISNVRSLGQAAQRRGRTLRLKEETGMKVVDSARSFPDNHFAEITIPGSNEKRIVHVFMHRAKDHEGKDMSLPYFLDDPFNDMSAEPLLNAHSPKDLGVIGTLLDDSKLRSCYEAVVVIANDDPRRPQAILIEAAMRMMKRANFQPDDTSFVAREALRWVEDKNKRRRESFDDMRAFFEQDQKGPGPR